MIMKKICSIIVLLLLVLAPAATASGMTLSFTKVAKPLSYAQSICIKTGTSQVCFPARISISSPTPTSKLIIVRRQPINSGAAVTPGSTAVTAGNPSYQKPTADSSTMQQEMLGYINTERAKANAPALVLDQKLSDGAAIKSKDMAQNNYFSHTSPTYGSPFDMMKSLGITYRTAGENIAKHTSVKGAHDAFMNSPGHKANILNTGFKKLGLGFYVSGDYIYVTQWFNN